ncbi:TonB-dependent receptor [Spongiimicrobium sp. 3-5]|uniref:TonB-dependent receptor n=1 Tax=Spongiimicrobium sp. 3-5 TaxID=3332596 RepID=UPI003980F457
MKLFVFFFFLFTLNCLSQNVERGQVPQNDQKFAELLNNLEKYNNENPIEKVYLHLDRHIASAGDDLWYTAYLTLGQYHIFSNASKVLYVDLINTKNEVVISQTQALVNGRCNGSITIPKELPLGNYLLRAYSKWMTNYEADFFFYKTITVTDNRFASSPSRALNDKINVQFFPEGGQLVEEVPSRVALKAIDDDGLGKEIKGRIVDANDKFICNISSTSKGFGLFQLHPETGNTYRAILDDGSVYKLPAAIQKGYSMSLNNLDFEKVKVRVSASDLFKNKPFYIVGTNRNQKVFHAKFVLNQNSFFDLEIPKDALPSGVLTITLFDEDKRPRCERLVFIDNQQEFKVKVTPSSNSFTKSAPISLHINIKDENDRPVSTQLSIAVTNADYIEKNGDDRNILTYLLLESDVKGHIDSPNAFFRDKKRSTRFNMDLIMMTHGWRRYKWQHVINGTEQSKKHYFEKGITVSGMAFGRDKKPLANTLIKMIGLNDTGFFAYPAITNDLGHFKIINVHFVDTISVTFNGYNRKNKPIDVDITLDQNDIFPVGKLDTHNMRVGRKKEIDSFREAGYNSGDFDSIFDKLTELDEVVVSEKEVKRPESPSTYGIVPDAVVYQDENNPQDLSLLLSRIPGVMVSGGIGGLDAKVTIRGGTSSFTSSTEPLWVIDGAILSSPQGSYNPIQFLERSNVERIEVLKGSSAANFGMRGSNGVILIYTKTGKPGATSLNSKSNFEYILSHSGEKEFYNPVYDKSNKEQKRLITVKRYFGTKLLPPMKMEMLR